MCVCTCMCACVCACVRACVPTCINLCVGLYVRACVCVHVHLATHHWQQEVQSVLQYGLSGDLTVEWILQASEAQVSVDL